MHVVVVKWQQRNVPKRLIHRVQNDYFSLVFVHTRPDSFSCRYEKILYNGTPIRYVHLTLKIDAAQILSVTEIAPKSRFLCMNRSPILYSFRAVAKATLHSVTLALV